MTEEHLRSGAKRLSRAEQDLLAAIERIATGNPRNRENKRLLKLGKLTLTPTYVAREAGRSRQSIYRSVRVKALLSVKARLHSEHGNSMKSIVDEIREDRRSIAAENQVLISNLARANKVVLDVLEENQELQKRLDRRRARLDDALERIRLLELEKAQLELEMKRHLQRQEAN